MARTIHTVRPLFQGRGDDLYANIPDLLAVLLMWENGSREHGNTASAAAIKTVREELERTFNTLRI